jgi:membrane protein
MVSIWRNLPFLLRRTIISAANDRCFSIAKGAAYSALLSFFPVLTSAAAIFVEVRAEFVSGQITRFLSEVLPPGTEQAVIMQLSQHGTKPIALIVVADLLALWAGSSVMKSLIEGFHSAYRVPRSRGFFHETGVAVMLVLASLVPFLVASGLILFGQEIERQVLRWLQIDPLFTPLAELWAVFSRMARYVVAIAATVALMTILYYFGPYRRQKLRLVVPGAILATILWMGATFGFGWWVRNVSNYNVLYGSIGTGIALLIWMYLLAAIAILGCEFNAEYERMISLETK